MTDGIVAVLVLIGSAFAFLGALGLVRMPDFYTRMHPPTKATTLGTISILLASAVHFTVKEGRLSLQELLVTAFLFLTAPIGAHLLSKAAIKLGVPFAASTQVERLPDT
ncbi:Na(+)/H(+) antiporter subunit G [bacterium HR17]|uniref:Na(+)/H(+) antiporter subunit G n=1 Tax=Candidatus Fervidibacter japonicus TaxID=2035412 RepID=A0A2H5X9A0_9BACT|nr:Na(+)/H(+) antiporter subunit G [bacterium HR17]